MRWNIFRKLLPLHTTTALRTQIDTLPSWTDGSTTAGKWGRDRKRCSVLSEEAGKGAADLVARAIFESEVASIAYPLSIAPPVFLRYEKGEYYRPHCDSPWQSGIRTDLSFTLSLSSSEEYVGGALRFLDSQPIRLSQGDLVLYDSSMRHEVEEVTSGTRIVCVGWIQSMVRDSSIRWGTNILREAVESLHSAGRTTTALDLEELRTLLLQRHLEV